MIDFAMPETLKGEVYHSQFRALLCLATETRISVAEFSFHPSTPLRV